MAAVAAVLAGAALVGGCTSSADRPASRRPRPRRRPRAARRTRARVRPGRLRHPVPLRRGHPRPQGRGHQPGGRARWWSPGPPSPGTAWPSPRCAPTTAGAPGTDGRVHDRVRRPALRLAAGRRRRSWWPPSTGAELRLPLRVEDPGLLVRLPREGVRASAARRRGRRTADLGVLDRPRRGGGAAPRSAGAAPPGRVGHAGPGRRPRRQRALRPVPASGRLPAVLGPRSRVLSVPVCAARRTAATPHARGQSSQTFLFSAYLRVAGTPTQRLVLVPPVPVQTRLLALLDRACAQSGGAG